jgi:hypothetical protein
MRRITILVLLCSLLLSGVTRAASGMPTIDWYVIGGGGGHDETPNFTTLDNTIGQPVVGAFLTTDCELCSGFWCGAAAEYAIYLPMVVRE